MVCPGYEESKCETRDVLLIRVAGPSRVCGDEWSLYGVLHRVKRLSTAWHRCALSIKTSSHHPSRAASSHVFPSSKYSLIWGHREDVSRDIGLVSPLTWPIIHEGEQLQVLVSLSIWFIVHIEP